MGKVFDLIKKYCIVCNAVREHVRNQDEIMCGTCHRKRPLQKM